MKRRTLIGFCFRPDASPVSVEDALDQGQAHPGSFKFILAVQPLEDTEELVGVPWIEPDAVVLDVIEALLRVASTADFNPGYLPLPGTCHGVGQQISQN